MKTIAITIDEETLRRLDALVSNGKGQWKSRSEVFRAAASEFAARFERLLEEERERRIFRAHRDRLARECRAMARSQASP